MVAFEMNCRARRALLLQVEARYRQAPPAHTSLILRVQHTVELRGAATTKPGTLLKRQTPIRTFAERLDQGSQIAKMTLLCQAL